VEVGRSLDGIVEMGSERREGALDPAIVRADRVGGVDEGGSAHGVGDLRHRDLAGVEHAVSVSEIFQGMSHFGGPRSFLLFYWEEVVGAFLDAFHLAVFVELEGHEFVVGHAEGGALNRC